jgi:hypothetical protein
MPYTYKNVLNLQLPGADGKNKAPMEALTAIMHPDYGPGSIDLGAITPMPPWAANDPTRRENWMLEHWGVPGNASGLEESVRTYDGGFTIEFDTIGSPVRELMKKLSMMFPDIPGLMVDYIWASADVGKAQGMVQFQGGDQTYEYIPEPGSAAAFELAFDVFATDAADHGLVFDPELGTYRYGGPEQRAKEDQSEA